MKKIAFLILLGVMTTFAWAQTAQSTMIELDKTSVPGVIITITNYDAATVQAALTARLERIGGLKGTNFKGFRLYSGQVLTGFGSTKYDIYTRVVPGNKKNPEVIVNLMVSSETFASPTTDPELNQKMIEVLTNFATVFLPEFAVNQKVSAYTKDLEKLEKEYKKLTSDRDKLKTSLDKQEKAVSTKAEEIAKIKAALGSLKR